MCTHEFVHTRVCAHIPWPGSVYYIGRRVLSSTSAVLQCVAVYYSVFLKRDKRAGDMTAQAATHRLIELIFKPKPADLHLMRDAKEELEHIIHAVKGASIEAAVIGKIMTIQIQFSKSGRQDIRLQCVAGKWAHSVTSRPSRGNARCQKSARLVFSCIARSPPTRLTNWRHTLSNPALPCAPAIPMAPSDSAIVQHQCLNLACQCSTLQTYWMAPPELLC